MSKIEVNAIEPQCGTTLTLGASGDTVALASGASQTGFGRTGTVDWDTTPKTATFTAVSGNGYFCNTSGGVITVNLPAGVAGAIVSLADYAATWQTNNVTVTPNGTDKIGSVNLSVVLNTQGQSVTLVFVDSTQGWINTMDSTSNVRASLPFIAATGGTILTNGDFKTHVFTGPGTFCVSAAGTPAGSTTLEYLVAAGGGNSGSGQVGCTYASGGGGGGGFRLFTIAPGSNSPLNAPAGLTASAQGYPIVVGGGGTYPGTGNNSIFSTIVSSGGGGGGRDPNSGTADGGSDGQAGGSGGGGGDNAASGGIGNNPSVSPPQGNTGGNSTGAGLTGGGGAGGAGAVGNNAGPSTGGAGGIGSYISDTIIGPTAPSYGTPGPVGSTRYFSGGGGGGGGYAPSAGTGSAGGSGGGGCGSGSGQGVVGTVNTGGGGGGARGSFAARAGGSGIVIIRYKFQ